MRIIALLFVLSGSYPLVGGAQTPVPPLTGQVMDHAQILSSETRQTLSDLLRAHEDSTGNQIAILTINALQGEAIESFALRAARSYELGTSEHSNGVLLVVALEERKVRIEVGYGLEGALPDVTAAQIIRNEIVPHFRNDDYDRGVEAGTTAILEAVAGEYVASEGEEIPPLFVRLIFGTVIGFGLVLAGVGVVLGGGGAERRSLSFFSFFIFLLGILVTYSILGAAIGLLLYVVFLSYLSKRPGVVRIRERVAAAEKAGETAPIKVGPFTINAGGSRGSSFFSGFGSSSGGFSGGGGSFGGGGASGGW